MVYRACHTGKHAMIFLRANQGCKFLVPTVSDGIFFAFRNVVTSALR